MFRRWYDFERQFINEFNDALRALDQAQRTAGVRSAEVKSQGDRDRGVRLYDAGDHLELLAEVPGLSQESIQINLQNDVLSLRYERQVKPPEGYSVHRQERSGVKVARSFALPCEVDEEKTSAHLKDGLLTVKLMKAPLHQPRQIQIQAS